MYQPELTLDTRPLSATAEETREYLEICLRLAPHVQPKRNLNFLYEHSVNPYAVFWSWYQLAELPIAAEYQAEFDQLQTLADQPAGAVRSQYTNRPPQFEQPYLKHLLTICALDAVFRAVFVHDHVLQHYVQASGHLRREFAVQFQNIHDEHQIFQWFWCKFSKGTKLAKAYTRQVRDPLIKIGSRARAHYYRAVNQILNEPTHGRLPKLHHVNDLAEALQENTRFPETHHFRICQFLKPADDELHFIQTANQGPYTHLASGKFFSCFDADVQDAVPLCGRINNLPATLKHYL